MKKVIVVVVVLLLAVGGFFLLKKTGVFGDKKERFEIFIIEAERVDDRYKYELSFENNGVSVTAISGVLNFIDLNTGEVKYTSESVKIEFGRIVTKGSFGNYSLFVSEDDYFGTKDIKVEFVLEFAECGWYPGDYPTCD